MPYTVCILLACLLAILPAALVFDMVSPLSKWENWQWQGQPNPRPQLRRYDDYPRLLRAEASLFRVLVVPPAFAAKSLGLWPGNYGLNYVSPGTSSEAWASLPPAALALEHLRRAIPFWLVTSFAAYELGGFLRRRTRGVRVA